MGLTLENIWSMVFDLCLGYLEDLDEDPHGMVKEGRSGTEDGQ